MIKKWCAIASVVLLAGCGGAGDPGNAPQPGTPAPAVPTVPPAPPPADPVPPPVAPPTVPNAPADGTLLNTVVFGTSPAADVPLAQARFSLPEDAVEATDGTIYVSDTQSHVIKQVKAGIVSVFAGTFAAGYNGDGQKLKTAINTPTALQLSADEKFLLFADSGNNLLRKIDIAGGTVTTFAGKKGNNTMPTDGTLALGSSIGYVVSLRWDLNGNLWFPTTSHTSAGPDGGLFYIDPAGIVHHKAVEGVGPFVSVRDISIGPGYLDFMRDYDFFRVYDGGTVKQRKMRTSFGKGIVTEGTRTLVASHTTLESLDADLNATLAAEGFANLSNIRKAKQGYLITDSDQGVLYRYDNGVKSQISGTEPTSYGALVSVVKYTDTSVLILDNQRARIFLLDLGTSESSVWAGTGGQSWASITPDKLQTTFYYPNGLAVDAAKNVYVVEQHRILKINIKGEVSLLAGDRLSGDQDGTGANARFRSPGSIAVDASGNVIVPDTYNSKVRKISPDGVVTTIAGTGVVDMPSFGVPATQSALNHPLSVAVLADGSTLIADGWNNSVYKLGTDGTLRLFAGKPNRTGYQGTGTFSGDGQAAVDAGMNTPAGLAVRGDTVYIADQFNQRVRAVGPDGIIHTLAGSVQGFSPEGSLLSFPRELVVLGNQLLAADTGNRNIVRYRLP